MNEKFCILIPNSLKFVPKCPIDNMLALVQVMAWHQIGNKPLPEPMLIQFTDAYMRHLGRWVKENKFKLQNYTSFLQICEIHI